MIKFSVTTIITVLLSSPFISFCSEPDINPEPKKHTAVESIGIFFKSEEVRTVKKTIVSAASTAASLTQKATAHLFAYSSQYLRDKNYIASNSIGQEEDQEFCVIPEDEHFISEENFKKRLQENPTLAMHEFNQFVESCFKNKKEENLLTQKELAHIFALAQKVSLEEGKDFSLAPLFAAQHNSTQNQFLTTTLQHHATQIEPLLSENLKTAKEKSVEKKKQTIQAAKLLCEQEIKQAEDTYEMNLTTSRETLAIIAANGKYIDSQKSKNSDGVSDFPAHDLAIYESSESYKEFLTTLQNKAI